MLFYPISAALILFSNILLNPASPSATADLKHLGECLEYMQKKFDLSWGLSERNFSHMKHIRRAAEELFRMGQKAVAEARQSEIQSPSDELEMDMEHIMIG